jgi:hypothetical protein
VHRQECLCHVRGELKMEARKWEEELAGRWREISALVAGGSGAQEGMPLLQQRINQRSVIRNQKRRNGRIEDSRLKNESQELKA